MNKFAFFSFLASLKEKRKTLRKEDFFARLTATQINKRINKKAALYVNFCEFERKMTIQKEEIIFFSHFV